MQRMTSRRRLSVGDSSWQSTDVVELNQLHRTVKAMTRACQIQ